MSRLRRGNFIFVTWVGDHSPKHVHVYRDGKLVVKWDLEEWQAMTGRATARIVKYLVGLRKEGSL